MPELRIGTAGWTIPSTLADQFSSEGTSLDRYSARFTCAEINSTFHRSHRPSTYERWALSTPPEFRFSAKLPKTITHVRKLAGAEDLLARYLDEIAALGDRLAVHLVQLPPKLQFDQSLAADFFARLKARTALAIVCEPRHPTWFEPDANGMLADLEIARVAADPAPVPDAAVPGGWPGLIYYRLHGSPSVYRSSYQDGRLEAYAAQIKADRPRADIWCLFDNTASSAATGDALALEDLLTN